MRLFPIKRFCSLLFRPLILLTLLPFVPAHASAVSIPGFSLSTNVLNFDTVFGSSDTNRLTITNPISATGRLVLDSFYIKDQNFVCIACGSFVGETLAPGSSIMLNIEFNSEHLGVDNSSLIISHNADGSPGVVSLRGFAEAVPEPGTWLLMGGALRRQRLSRGSREYRHIGTANGNPSSHAGGKYISHEEVLDALVA